MVGGRISTEPREEAILEWGVGGLTVRDSEAVWWGERREEEMGS